MTRVEQRAERVALCRLSVRNTDYTDFLDYADYLPAGRQALINLSALLVYKKS